MSTEALFQQDAYLKSCEAEVLECSAAGIVLSRTVFYPLGGGQPGDGGWLRARDGRSVRIVDTRKGEQGCILHVPEAPAPTLQAGDAVTAEIDWERRYLHMRMHTALHLLGSVLRFGVTGGQIAADKSRLDFDTQEEIDRERVTALLNDLIRADTAVESQWITDEELARQPELIRTMSVRPPVGAGRVRLLNIPGVDLQPCGGTHVARTGEIGAMQVAKVENKGKHNKRVYISWGATPS
ncbi:MAG TPA: alanyl-tRNA editing protein [Steroidobacteraceae bacterium]|nr:alanyl-tRNA editing protein [Steroidobacteraceae bacterium]